MKKAMKLVSLVLAVVMLLGCLGACSSKSATTDSTASTDTASTDTAASDSSEASSDGGEIVIALISNTTGCLLYTSPSPATTASPPSSAQR